MAKPARCNICGLLNSAFRDYNGRVKAKCPQCHGLERHRSVFKVFQQLKLFTRFKLHAPLLMISMDIPYFEKLKEFFNVVVLTMEMDQEDTVHGDICTPPFAPRSFVAAVQVHTMEHVKDDRQATRNIYQLLVSGGIYISNVPCAEGKTVEFDSADPDQHGHWRMYGVDDYLALLRNSGFVRVRHAGPTFIAEKD